MAYNNESDRRSNISSFYGGRKSSLDALNAQELRSGMAQGGRNTPLSQAHGPSSGPGSIGGAPNPPGSGRSFTSQQDQARARRDSASSFFDPRRVSQAGGEMLAQSAGYNRASFFDVGMEAPVKGGRDEEENVLGYGIGGRGDGRGRGVAAGNVGGAPGGVDPNDNWDVYADFNNAGPRYSTAFVKYDEGYQQLPPQSPEPGTRSKVETDSITGPVEMVTVPALGAEWKKSEMDAMRKSNRKKDRADSRWRKFRAWTRDQTGLCGKWGTRKQIVIGGFIVCCVVGIILAFTIPRVPGFAFASEPLTNVTSSDSNSDQTPLIFSRVPANFSFPANLHLRVDTGGSFVPIRFSKLHADLFDLQTSRQVAEGDLDGTVVPGKSFKEMFIPMNFTYVASNTSDQTWTNWYNACRNPGNYPDGQRPGVPFRITLSMNIVGLIGTKKASSQVPNADCPVVLPINAV